MPRINDAKPLGNGINSGMVVNIPGHIHISPGSQHIGNHAFPGSGTNCCSLHHLIQIAVYLHICQFQILFHQKRIFLQRHLRRNFANAAKSNGLPIHLTGGREHLCL